MFKPATQLVNPVKTRNLLPPTSFSNRKVTVNVEGTSSVGFNLPWLRNAVEDPLNEANIGKLPDDH